MIKVFQEDSSPINFNSFNFPAGEKHVKLELPTKYNSAYIEYFFDGSDSIMELLLVCDALKRSNYKLKHLLMKYCPFAQQDRVMVVGEPLSIKVFAGLINHLGFEKVIVCDPHSDVVVALLNNCEVVTQWEIFSPLLKDKTDYYLISPDGGALKKINKLARIVKSPIIFCEKERDVETGEILKTVVYADNLGGWDAVIVDDICIGGRTFIEIAKVLRTKKCGKITLMVSHFFTKDLTVFDNLIDEIYTKDGKIK